MFTKMTTAHVTACQPGICLKNISLLNPHDSKPFLLPMSITPSSPIFMTLGDKPSLVFKSQPIFKSRKPLHLCFAAGKGMMENNENSPWKSLTNAMEKFKGKSIEDVLRQQIQKGEYLDNGGSGSKPPGSDGGGGGDGGSGRPDGTGGSEDESFLGIQDETLQVILATGALLSFYVYLLCGKEVLKLIWDIIKYVFGGGVSSRLRRILMRLGSLYGGMGKKKEVVDEYWLEKVILRTPTWWYDPRDFRQAVRNYYASSASDPDGDEDEDEDEDA